ncbi:MAG: hypothetical protein IT379_12980 [Deltaproteobacteria bacterium]|nr:hypothetical protein [Deltaproteobacteria bacterium]
MDNAVWLLIGVVGAVVFVALIVVFVRQSAGDLGPLLEVPRLDVSAVREMQDVRVHGAIEVAEEDGLIAPVSGRRVVAYLVRVQEHVTEQRGGGETAQVVRTWGTEERSTPFHVRDATGALLVRPDGFEILSNSDWSTGEAALPAAAVDRVEAMLARLDLPRRVPGSKRFFVERAVAVDRPVALSGRARREVRGEPPQPVVETTFVTSPTGGVLRMSQMKRALDAK